MREQQRLQQERDELERKKRELSSNLEQDRNRLKLQLQKVAEVKIALKNKELELQAQEMNLRQLQRQIGQQRLKLEEEEVNYCRAKAALQMKHVEINRRLGSRMKNEQNLSARKRELEREYRGRIDQDKATLSRQLQEQKQLNHQHHHHNNMLANQLNQLDSYRTKLESMHKKLRHKEQRVFGSMPNGSGSPQMTALQHNGGGSEYQTPGQNYVTLDRVENDKIAQLNGLFSKIRR